MSSCQGSQSSLGMCVRVSTGPQEGVFWQVEEEGVCACVEEKREKKVSASGSHRAFGIWHLARTHHIDNRN